MLLKICGLKDSENIKQVALLKPDFMGFIFYAESKRFVGEDFVMPEISSEIKKVGVFVNATASYISEKSDQYDLDYIQIHGDEDSVFCSDLCISLCTRIGKKEIKLIKAFGIDEHFDFDILDEYSYSCDYFLFDTKAKEYGGSGRQFDWTLLENYSGTTPFFLSGGLGLEYIKKVQSSKFKVQAIDVNSMFEIEPGIKDINKLKKINLSMLSA